MAPRSILPLLVLALCAGCAQAERMVNDAMNTAGTAGAGVVETTPVEWRTTASRYSASANVGRRYAYDCPPNGRLQTVWGANPYTSDSSVCTAGVQMGVITREAGGRVVFEMRPGQSSYPAASRNGVASNDYGSWRSSFAVLPR